VRGSSIRVRQWRTSVSEDRGYRESHVRWAMNLSTINRFSSALSIGWSRGSAYHLLVCPHAHPEPDRAVSASSSARHNSSFLMPSGESASALALDAPPRWQQMFAIDLTDISLRCPLPPKVSHAETDAIRDQNFRAGVAICSAAQRTCSSRHRHNTDHQSQPVLLLQSALGLALRLVAKASFRVGALLTGLTDRHESGTLLQIEGARAGRG
jgi:hypothetical protein